MIALPRKQESGSWIEGIWEVWSDWIKRHRALSELSELNCNAKDEFERIAGEVGVSKEDIYKLVSRGPGASNLLLNRMTVLDLDWNEVSQTQPQVFQELKKNCALCNSRRQCVEDFARDSSDPIWERYCPNVGTLLALDVLPWTSRREW